MPVYWLYSLLFVDRGVSEAQLSMLLAVWSLTAVVAEVPTGALADRWSRRGSIVLGGALEAAGFLAWLLWPEFPGFVCGFVLWGIGGACASGAIEALLHDGLAATGSSEAFASVMGRVRAAELAVQPGAAVVATVLFAVGGHGLVLWLSVAWALAAASVAFRLPEAPRLVESGDDDLGYVATLRAGLVEAASSAPVRGAVVMVAVVGGIDAIDEFFPLLARGWGVPTAWTPISLAVISLVGAAGAAFAGRASGASLRAVGLGLGAAGAVLLLGATALPIGLPAVAGFYGVFRLVTVVLETRLQARITGRSRATVGSVAAVGTELSALTVFAAWAWQGLPAVAVFVLLAAAVVARRRSG